MSDEWNARKIAHAAEVIGAAADRMIHAAEMFGRAIDRATEATERLTTAIDRAVTEIGLVDSTPAHIAATASCGHPLHPRGFGCTHEGCANDSRQFAEPPLEHSDDGGITWSRCTVGHPMTCQSGAGSLGEHRLHRPAQCECPPGIVSTTCKTHGYGWPP